MDFLGEPPLFTNPHHFSLEKEKNNQKIEFVAYSKTLYSFTKKHLTILVFLRQFSHFFPLSNKFLLFFFFKKDNKKK